MYQLSYPYTGDYRIDALLEGYPNQTGLSALGYQWNAGRALGSPVQVTYSFMSAAPQYGGTNEGTDTGFQPFNEAQKAAVRSIMGQLSLELGITLIEKADSTNDYGQIRFGNNYQETSTGYSWLPYQEGDRGGDVWIDVTPENSTYPVNPNLRDLSPGSEGYGTLLHEIGHALGLKHPGDYNAGSGGSGLPGNYLDAAEDNETYTVMSYTAPAGGQQRDWFGMYDLLALKTLYGSRNYNAGDTVYSYTDATGRLLKIVDDGSGFDTIDISGVSSAGNRVVDMRPGSFSSIGVKANGQKAVQNVSIDFSTVVEKFVGTGHGDIVTGNDANNVFVLGPGSNVADGGAGIDLVQYAGNRAGYQGAGTGGGLQVTGNGVSDTLSNIERLAFADSKLALDVGGNAGTAAKILGAVFDAPIIRSEPGSVGLALAKVDAGMSYTDLLALALDIRLGTARTDQEVVELLYTNIAGVAPSAEQAAPYLAQLDSSAVKQAGLAVFAAETAENTAQIDLVGLAQTGLIYV
ncbi:MAG: M10 family metallopeptidase C-terminal domain-containing protein [Ramlibacter sp.]